MTPICTQPIVDPSAWTGRELGGKDKLRFALNDEQLSAIDALLGRTRHLAPQQVTRADFDHPAINAMLLQLRSVVMDGRGLALVTGITPGRYTEEQFQRIYWGFGTHLGVAAVQSALGDRLGYVETKPDDTIGRGYRSLQELVMHTDSYEVVGLMCVRAAKSGGLSGLVSSLAIHNEILRTRPELLPPLYRGFFHASDEAKVTRKPITDREIPVYSYVDGKVSCSYQARFMKAAAELMHVPMPDGLEEALAYFAELAERDDLVLRFLLEPGEMMIWHNYTNLHSRTAFENFPDRRRLLLRLWLTVPNGRPYDSAFLQRAETYERIYGEAREKAPSA